MCFHLSGKRIASLGFTSQPGLQTSLLGKNAIRVIFDSRVLLLPWFRIQKEEEIGFMNTLKYPMEALTPQLQSIITPSSVYEEPPTAC